MALSPASGTGKFYKLSAKIIRFARHGCTNRPFFHIVVTEVNKRNIFNFWKKNLLLLD